MTKPLTLPQLQALDLPCVFCGVSSKKSEGGYFCQKYLCSRCSNKLMITENFLRREKVGLKKWRILD